MKFNKYLCGYFFSLILIVGCSKNYQELGSGYRFEENGRHELVVVNDKGIYVVDGNILSYAVNDQVIILAQRSRDIIPECQGEYTLKECKKAFNKSTYLQYWIIDKNKEKAIYGPYQQEEYLQKRRELNLPESLQLKSTESL